MTVRRLGMALCAVVALTAGCSSAKTDSGLSAKAGATLQADVLSLTRAAAAGNRTLASAALSRLRSDLAAALATGDVSAARARTIQARLTAITADLAPRTPTPTRSAPASTPHSTHAAPPSTTKPAAPTSHTKGHDGHGKHKHGADH
jgi:hypothetical protein